MLKRILGMAAAAVLALAGMTGVASARDDRAGKEGVGAQDPFTLDQHSMQPDTEAGGGDLPESRIWGGDERSGGPSQNHTPDWSRKAPVPVRTVDVPAEETETTSETIRPEYEAYGDDKVDQADAGASGMETDSQSLKPESKDATSVDMNKATPHLALLDSYLASASVQATALSSLKGAHAKEAKRNLELSISKSIEHANHLSKMDLDSKELLSHLREAKKSLKSDADLSSHISAARDSFSTLAEGAAYSSTADTCGDRQPVRGVDDSKMGEHRHTPPMDIDRDSTPGQDSIPGTEDKDNLPPPAQPDAPVSEDVSK